MVAVKKKWSYLPDGTIDIENWLQQMVDAHQLKDIQLLRQAYQLAEKTAKGLTTFYGQPCIEQGLEMAALILNLKLDQEAGAAALLISVAQTTTLAPETIKTELNEPIAKLVSGVLQLNVINSLAKIKSRDQLQIDRLRKTLLAMVSDIRVVLIKLAERTSLMRGIKNINPTERKRLAQETMDLYAPLANRLGIGQLKWELEDLAFHYMDPVTYKSIAKFLMDRRADRELTIHEIIHTLKSELKKTSIHADLSGRAKHIYSIFLKMQRKHLTLTDIYDYSAIRILVPTIQDCYQALSLVHQLWDHIPEEFDDYISNPKPNGYRSIHTAVVGHQGKTMEIQIRTHEMHSEAEQGVAAHWIYKEDQPSLSGYESKITFLRRLLQWHHDVAEEESVAEKINQQMFEDNVYVFTPAGDILDLPVGATPLDFAYHIHSELGHRCRGAKINKHIVPLTYQLQTGDQIEIITTKTGGPSRDWLNKESGYLGTARARSKVAQWFRHLEITQYVDAGKHTLEKEFARLNIHPNLQKLANHFQFKDDTALFAAVGHGTVKPAQILQAAQIELHHRTHEIPAPTLKKTAPPRGSKLAGTDNLLTRVAKCCKPIPGEQIIGYITQGRGVSIHRKNCQNISGLPEDKIHRFLEVSWDSKQLGNYYAELQIKAYGREDLLREMTSILANIKIDLVNLNSTFNKKTNMMYITMTIQIENLDQLNQLTNQLNHLPNILEIKRINK